jgi:hypothetical protein
MDSRVLLPDRNIGRVEIRLSDLQGLPERFSRYMMPNVLLHTRLNLWLSWYELWDKQLSGNTVSYAARKRHLSDNLGAIQARIAYKYQYHASRKAPYTRKPDSWTSLTHIQKGLSKDKISSETLEEEVIDKPRGFSYSSSLPTTSENPTENERVLNSFSNSSEREYHNSSIQEEEEMFISTSQEEKTSFLGKLGNLMVSEETLKAITAIKRLMAAFGNVPDLIFLLHY